MSFYPDSLQPSGIAPVSLLLAASPAFDTFAKVMLWACIAVMVVFAVLNVPFAFPSKDPSRPKPQPSQVFSVFWAVVAEIILLLTIFVPEWPNKSPALEGQSVLSVIVGAAVGWLLGMYVSPKDQPEKQEFEKVKTALAGILSGVTLASVWSYYNGHQSTVIAHALQIAAFAITMLLTTAAVYNSRAYDIAGVAIFSLANSPLVSSNPITLLALKSGDTHTFIAQVTGTVNPSVTWSVTPVNPAAYALHPETGVFNAISPSKCIVIATSIENPSLSNGVTVTIQ